MARGAKRDESVTKPEAPWGNSTFEAEARDFSPSSEYSTTYYAKPGDCKAKPIRPKGKNWVVGNVSEKIDANTTYDSVFKTPDNKQREQAFRPNENGVIYDIGEASSMTTTHDRAYTTEEFPAERKIPRQEDDCDKLPTTTMKQDFGYKQATEIVKPYLPPVGLSDTFGNDQVKLVSTNQETYVDNNLKTIEPVKNCKPVRSYKKPSSTMVCETTTHSAFTGASTKPAKSCKPKQ